MPKRGPKWGLVHQGDRILITLLPP
jgi:hypothetical protein